MRYSIEGDLIQQQQNCVFVMATDQITKSEAVPIVVWEVPCGNKEHAGIVSLVTFISAIASASLIVVTSIRHSYLTSTSAAKQS